MHLVQNPFQSEKCLNLYFMWLQSPVLHFTHSPSATQCCIKNHQHRATTLLNGYVSLSYHNLNSKMLHVDCIKKLIWFHVRRLKTTAVMSLDCPLITGLSFNTVFDRLVISVGTMVRSFGKKQLVRFWRRAKVHKDSKLKMQLIRINV